MDSRSHPRAPCRVPVRAALTMSARTELRLYPDEIGQVLEPGERLLAASGLTVAKGRWELEQPPDERSGARKAVEGALGVILYPVLADSPSLARRLGGVAVAGRLGSWARRLTEVRGAPLLLVTGTRLLLARSEGSGKRTRYSIALEIPRDALQQVARQGRPFARGRVVLTFCDGSFVALSLGAFRTGPAARLVAAIGTPGALPAP